MRISIKNHFLSLILLLAFSTLANAQSYFDQSILPKPSGSYKIGLMSLSLTDSSRAEKYLHHSAFRRVQLDIWYPANPDINAKNVSYLEGFSSKLIYDIFKSKGIRMGLLDSIKKTPTHASLRPAVASGQSKFPLIIFSPGFYFGMAPLYSAFMENLASQGYIVCSISHPYEQPYIKFTNGDEAYLKKKKSQLTYLQLWWAYKLQFRKPDSPEQIERITRNYLRKLKRFDRMVDLWKKDIEFVLNYFEQSQKKKIGEIAVHKMDLSRIGIFGQSFGGALAGQLCVDDKRVLAGLNLDGFQFGDLIDKPLQKPFMLIQSGYNALWNYGNSAIYAHPKADFYLVDIPKARHLIFSDAALLTDVPQVNKLDMIGHVQGPLVLNQLNQLILAFFNFYLKDKEAPLLQKNLPFRGITIEMKSPKSRQQHQ
jgi:predicted dienelactone hydrolase